MTTAAGASPLQPDLVLPTTDPRYEEARRGAIFHGRVPDRFPAGVARAKTEADVVRAIGYAAEHDLPVGIKSGGHSWSGNHLRDDTLLLDVSGLDSISIDVDNMTAVVGPGVTGDRFMHDLVERDLFFPGGHCEGVGLGGFLLQGGFGWNSRVHGPACMSVEALDLVTATGENLRVSAEHEPDLFWAARGSGPGFFAAVTAFHLRLYERPRVVMNRTVVYGLDQLETVITWAREISDAVPDFVELLVLLRRDPDGEVRIIVTAPVLADDGDQAELALSILETCPAFSAALEADPAAEVTFADLYAVLSSFHPAGCRCSADGMWSHAPASELLPGIRRIAETMPPAPSYMLWMNWGPVPPRPDMAFSLEDQIYLAVYGTWMDPAQDQAYVSWPGERMAEMESVATGIQLADENLDRRPARFLSAASAKRLDELRARFDPDGRFLVGAGYRAGAAM